ncbi:MAG: thiazole synthase [Chloroflexi bacterium]|nr:MAG: thiazole synthase [Chloroflexota bacterium]
MQTLTHADPLVVAGVTLRSRLFLGTGKYASDEAMLAALEASGCELVTVALEETLKAARILVEEGFKVLPYINADPVLARKLEEIGTVTVMPLGSPIGSGQGLQTLEQIRIIVDEAHVPVVVDAGIGVPSDAALAMELGADAVLVNSAVALAKDPALMAEAIKEGVEAGRKAYLAGRIPRRGEASASSPTEGVSRPS